MVYLQVLSGDTKAAEMLAAEVHRDLGVEEVDVDNLPQLNLPLEQCGMWIDPIGMTHILHLAFCYVSNSFGYCKISSICVAELLLSINCNAISLS
jgi:hypothetical protein